MTGSSTLPAAVRAGLIDEATIDRSLTRLMAARLRLGMFDPPAKVPWAQTPASANQSPQHDALARRTARESLVLLKNDGLLPLKPTLKRIAVVGPTADDPMSLLGNYYGTPAAPVTILQGIRDAAPQAEVVYARGSDLVEGREDPNAAAPIDARYLRPAAGASQNGLTGDYFRGRALAGQPVLTRIDPRIAFRWDRNAPTDDAVGRGELQPGQALGKDDFSVRWHGQLLPPVSGNYELQIAADDGVRLYLDGKPLIDQWSDAPRMRSSTATVALQAGKAYDLRVEYYEATRDAGVRLAWRMPGAKPPLQEAVDAARNADVVVFVGGLTGDVEGEEMDVNYPGFAGGDRTDTRLPKPQRELLQALQATGTPVVAVPTTGSAWPSTGHSNTCPPSCWPGTPASVAVPQWAMCCSARPARAGACRSPSTRKTNACRPSTITPCAGAPTATSTASRCTRSAMAWPTRSSRIRTCGWTAPPLPPMARCAPPCR